MFVNDGLLGIVIASPLFFSHAVGGVVIIWSRNNGSGNEFWPFSVCVGGRMTLFIIVWLRGGKQLCPVIVCSCGWRAFD